ncbi:hypothetical protein [Cyanobium sp. ATX-6F1]|uniref:hypothetical protein n=1 Tax=Cyanobium sp. ATX-6F1 TaxID=3137388 RepID=UPI0039BE5F0B
MPTLSLLEGFLGFLIATVALWAFRLSASPDCSPERPLGRPWSRRLQALSQRQGPHHS